MGNVDGVPVASQVKSLVQASRGDVDGAFETQERFSERCIGVAQIRSVAQAATGDLEGAALTQQRFFDNTQRLLDNSETADAVPGVSQLKSLALFVSGDPERAIETQANFTRRCPVVSQMRSGVEAFVLEDPDQAAATQRDFLRFADATTDRLPVVGHAKGLVFHALGEHDRGNQSIYTSTESTVQGASLVGSGLLNIVDPSTGSSSSSSGRNVAQGEEMSWAESHSQAPSAAAACGNGPLDRDDINRLTVCMEITPAICESHKACPICFENFAAGEQARMLPCFHTFHANCCERWLQMHGLCPVCRFCVREGNSAQWQTRCQ